MGLARNPHAGLRKGSGHPLERTDATTFLFPTKSGLDSKPLVVPRGEKGVGKPPCLGAHCLTSLA
jgi:hypothetical protein